MALATLYSELKRALEELGSSSQESPRAVASGPGLDTLLPMSTLTFIEQPGSFTSLSCRSASLGSESSDCVTTTVASSSLQSESKLVSGKSNQVWEPELQRNCSNDILSTEYTTLASKEGWPVTLSPASSSCFSLPHSDSNHSEVTSGSSTSDAALDQALNRAGKPSPFIHSHGPSRRPSDKAAQTAGRTGPNLADLIRLHRIDEVAFVGSTAAKWSPTLGYHRTDAL